MKEKNVIIRLDLYGKGCYHDCSYLLCKILVELPQTMRCGTFGSRGY